MTRAFIMGFKAGVEREYGVSFVYDSARPSLLDRIVVRGARIASEDGKALVIANRIEVSFDLAGFLFRGDSLVHGIRVNGLDLHLFRNGGMEALRSVFGRIKAKLSDNQAFPSDLTVTVRNARFNLELEGASALVALPYGDLSFKDGDILIGLRAVISASLGTGSAIPLEAEIPISVSGEIGGDFSEARLQVRTAVDSSILGIKEQGFIVLWRGDLVELRKIQDGTPMDLNVKLDPSAGRLAAAFAFERFKPSSLFRISRAPALAARMLDEPYSGTLGLETDGTLSGTSVSLELSGRVRLPELPDAFDYAMKASIAGGIVKLERFEAGSDRGVLGAKGTFSLYDRSIDMNLSVDYRPVRFPAGVVSEMRLFGREGEYYIFGDRLEVGSATLGPFTLQGELSGKTLAFALESGILAAWDREGATGDAAADDGRFTGISAEGILDLEGPSVLFDIRFDPITMDDLGIASLVSGSEDFPSFLRSATISGTASVASDFSGISYNTRNLVITSGSGGSAYAIVSLRGTPGALTVNDFFVSANGHILAGRGDAAFGPGSVDFAVDATLDGVPHRVQGVAMGGAVRMTGDYDLDLIAAYEDGALVGTVSSRGLPVSVLGRSLSLDFDFDGRFAKPDDWEVRISECAISSPADSQATIPALVMAGRVDQGSVEISSLTVKDRYSELNGTAEADFSIDEGLKATFRAGLASASGESYRLDGSFGDGEIDAAFSCLNAQLARPSSGRLAGLGSGTAGVSGRLEDPRILFDLSVADGRVSGMELNGSLKGSYAGGVLGFDGGVVRLENMLLDGIRSSIDFTNGRVELAAMFSALVGTRRVESLIELGGRFTIDPESTGEGRRLGNLRVTGHLAGLEAGKTEFGDVPVALDLESGIVSLTAGAGNEISGSYSPDGGLNVVFSESLPVSFRAAGQFSGESMAMKVDAISVDLGAVGAFLEIPAIDIIAGACVGKLEIRGNPRDPDFFGSLEITDAFLEVPDYALDRIGPVNAIAQISEKTFAIADDDIAAGKNARISARFTATLEQWSLEGFDVKVTTIGDSLVRGKTGIIPWIDISGDCMLDLGIGWDRADLAVTGTFFVPKAEIVIRPEANKPAARHRTYEYRIDIDARTGKNVGVYFPSRQLPILSGQTDPSSAIRFRADSSADAFSLEGNVALRGGELFYMQRNFFIKEATILFAENQDKFDPRVTLEAELRTRNTDGPVTIIVSAANSSLINLNPRIESRPALSTAEIAAMLGQDLLAVREDGSINVVNAMLNASELVPQLNFVRVFERNVKDVLGLDLFYVKTQVLQRWLVDASNLGGGVDPNATIEDYFDQTAIYAGKYIANDIFVEGSLFLQKNPLEQQGGLTIQSELGFEWATPLFTLDWRMRPETPDTLFLTDQSFSFYWKFVF